MSHTIHYGYICDGDEVIDEVLVMLMRGAYLYRRRYCGNQLPWRCVCGEKVLETVIKYGARPAEPGEFTKKAFLNGKMDLSQAEAVGDLITAQNEYALKSSVSQLKGNVKKRFQISDRKLFIIQHLLKQR